MSSRSFHLAALGGIVLVAVSYFVLPWLSFGSALQWTGIGMLGLDGGAGYSIGVLALTVLAAILTVVAIMKPNRIVKIAAIIAGLLIAFPLLPMYSDMASSSLGDGRSLFAIGFYLTAVGALIVAVANALGFRTKTA